MREVLPKAKAGRRTSASHLRKLSLLAGDVANPRPGSYLYGHRGVNKSAFEPFIQWVVEVDEVLSEEYGQYRVFPRYYDPTEGDGVDGWQTDTTDGPYNLDTSGVAADGEAAPVLAVGDRVIAFWHPQRGMFVNVSAAAGVGLIRFQLKTELLLGEKAEAYVVEWSAVDDDYIITDREIVVKDFTKTPGSWWGKVGWDGWCVLPSNHETGRDNDQDGVNDEGEFIGEAFYEIVWMETTARFIEFTTVEDLKEFESDENTPVADQIFVGLFTAEATVDKWWHIKTPGYSVRVVDPQGLFRYARSGAKGIAIYDEKRKFYVIIECQTKAGWVRGTLTSDLNGGEATANISQSGGTQQDTQAPSADGFKVYDPSGLFRRARNGAQYKAIFDQPLNRYVLFECQTKAGWVNFRLTGDVGGSENLASAVITSFGGTQQDVQDPADGTPFFVYDDTGLFPQARNGAVGKAIYNSVLDRYYIVSCAQLAIMMTGRLTADMSSADPTGIVDNYTILSQTPFSQRPDGDITALNIFGFTADEGATVLIVRDGITWKIIQIVCPA